MSADEQEAVVADIVAAFKAVGKLMVAVVVLVLPQTSVTRIVCEGEPTTGVTLENTFDDCAAAMSVVLSALYNAYV